jgi:hypothetical protein
MKFYMNIWLRHYKEAQQLGSHLSAHLRKVAKGEQRLDRDFVNTMEKKISIVTSKCSGYLDSCGLTLPPPKWRYDKDDTRTWASSIDFRYTHLMEI